MTGGGDFNRTTGGGGQVRRTGGGAKTSGGRILPPGSVDKAVVILSSSRAAATDEKRQTSEEVRKCAAMLVFRPQRHLPRLLRLKRSHTVVQLHCNRRTDETRHVTPSRQSIHHRVGPAGYPAAIHAARASLEPMIAGMQPGGQMTITTDVENYPGFEDVVQGPWLMEQMQKQAEHVGTRMIYDIITEVDFSNRPFRAKGDPAIPIRAIRSLSRPAPRRAGSAFRGRGHGLRSRLRHVRRLLLPRDGSRDDGGNTAVEEALYLTNHASKCAHPSPR